MSYLNNVWIAFDQLVNAIFKGVPNETISSRAWRLSLTGDAYWTKMVVIINKIFWLQNNHCRGAYAKDRERSQELREDNV